LKFSGGRNDVSKRVTTEFSNLYCIAYDPAHLLTLEYNNLNTERDTLCAEYNKLNNVLRGKISSTSTLEKLIKDWPEIEPFAKPYLDAAPGTLPTLRNDDLNTALGLPVS